MCHGAHRYYIDQLPDVLDYLPSLQSLVGSQCAPHTANPCDLR